MKEIFRTFYGSVACNDLEDKIATFAEEEGCVEVARSAPSITAALDGDFAIAVTSTFVRPSIDSKDMDEDFNEYSDSSDEEPFAAWLAKHYPSKK